MTKDDATPDAPESEFTESDFAAVVYDLDGTLVRLPVNWQDVASRLEDLLEREGVDADPLSAWDLLSAAEEAGIGDEADELIAAAERAGAEESHRLALADRLLNHDIPVGVCSLNHEEAVHIALDRHDLAGHVQSVVGRGTVPERKPNPRALLAAVEELGVSPEEVLFVGDSASDKTTAERAGTKFEWVEE